MRTTSSALLFLLCLSSSTSALNLKTCALTDAEKQSSIDEHVFGGFPSGGASSTYPRTAYVLSYDKVNLVPRWAAWHAHKSYRDTPERKSRWSTFRKDPELPKVTTRDYIGWFDSNENFALGHIVPFYISGGDRDHDGKDAEFESDLKVEDIDDACTVYEINAMSNIAPQYHDKFNGPAGGLWHALETDLSGMIDDGSTFNIFAGTVFKDGLDVQTIGNRKNGMDTWKIGVPHGFFKIAINLQREEAVAFLFDHAGDLEHGCDIHSGNLRFSSDCIVTIEQVEAETGLAFFELLTPRKSARLRSSSNKAAWLDWLED